MFFEIAQPILVVVLYLIGCYACWRAVNSFYDWRTGTLKGWAAQYFVSTIPAPVTKPPVAKKAPAPPPKSQEAAKPAAKDSPAECSPAPGSVDASPSPTPAGAKVVTEKTVVAEKTDTTEAAVVAIPDDAGAKAGSTFAPSSTETSSGAEMVSAAPTAAVETNRDAQPTTTINTSANTPSTTTVEFKSPAEPTTSRQVEFATECKSSETASSTAFAAATNSAESSPTQYRDQEASTASLSTKIVFTDSHSAPTTQIELLPAAETPIPATKPATPEPTTTTNEPAKSARLVSAGGSAPASPLAPVSKNATESAAALKPLSKAAPPTSASDKGAELATQENFYQQAAETLSRWKSIGESFCILLFEVDLSESDKELEETSRARIAQLVTAEVCESAKHDSLVAQQGSRVIVLNRNMELDEAKRLAERMRRAIARLALPLEQGTVQTTVSGGLAAVTYQENIDQVTKRANEALQTAVSHGRDRVFFHDGQRCRPVWRAANVEVGSPALVGAGVGASATSAQSLPSTSDDLQKIDRFRNAKIESGNLVVEQHRRSASPPKPETAPAAGKSPDTSDEKGDKKGKKEVDKRKAARTPLGRLHPIAPYAGNKRPKESEYRMMECNDISSSGFSFFARHPPSWSQLVVKILGRSLIAKIVHRTRTMNEDPEKRYLVGCYFTGSLEPLDGEKK